MNVVGHVHRRTTGAQIRVAANQDVGARRRDGIRRTTLVGEHAQCNRVELDSAEHRRVSVASPRVAIDLFDELGNGGAAVSHDLGGRSQAPPQAGRRRPAIDNRRPG